MAITPPSDIVLDVMQAADPTRQRAAAEKLTRMQSASASGADFGAAYQARVASDPAAALIMRNQASIQPTSVAGTGGVNKAAPVYRKFEAFVLQVFVESMLPKNAESVYGKGTAGGIWKSMLAEQIGKQIAEAGGVGIARHLEKADKLRAEAAANPPGAAPAGRAES